MVELERSAAAAERQGAAARAQGGSVAAVGAPGAGAGQRKNLRQNFEDAVFRERLEHNRTLIDNAYSLLTRPHLRTWLEKQLAAVYAVDEDTTSD